MADVNEFIKKRQEARLNSENKTSSPSTTVSSFLQKKAAERRDTIDNTFGADYYGGSRYQSPVNTSVPVANRQITLDNYDRSINNTARKAEHKANMGMVKTVPDVLAMYERPEQYTAENFQNYRDRAQALANLPSWNDEQRAEAEQLYDLFKAKGLASGGNISDMFRDTMYLLTKDAEKYTPTLPTRVRLGGDLYDDWGSIVEQLEYKTKPLGTAVTSGALKGTGALSLTEGLYNALDKAGVSDNFVQPGLESIEQLKQMGEYSQANAPVAYAAGNIAGNIGLLTGIHSGIAAIPGYSGLSSLAQSIISGASSMGGISAIQNIGDVSSGEMGVGEYLGNIGIGAAAGAAGGALSGVLGNAGINLITKKNLANNMIAKAVAAGLSGAGFAAGNTGVKYAAGKLGYKKGANITAGQVAQDILVGFAFGTINYLLRNMGNGFTRQDPDAEFDADTYEWKYFNKDMTPEEARALYRKLSMENHPDLGGDESIMQEINAEYEKLTNIIGKATTNKAASAYTTAAQEHAAGNEQAAAQAEAEFKENMLVIKGLLEDGIIAGTEAGEAVEVLDTVMNDGVIVPSDGTDTVEVDDVDIVPEPVTTPAENELASSDNATVEADADSLPTLAENALQSVTEAPTTPAPDMPKQPEAATGIIAVKEFADTLGKAGKKVFVDMYNPEQNAAGYVDAMMKAYIVGKNGDPFVGITSNIATEPQLKAAYIAGMADADKNGSIENTGNKEYIDNSNTDEISDRLPSPFTPAAERHFLSKDGGAKRRIVWMDYNGRYLVGDGRLMLTTDENGRIYAETHDKLQARPVSPDGGKRVEELINSVATNNKLITERPYEYQAGSHPALLFNTPDGQIVYDKKLFRLMDGGILHYDKDKNMIVAVDSNGNVTGALMAIRHDGNVDTTNLKQVNIKGLSSKKEVNYEHTNDAGDLEQKQTVEEIPVGERNEQPSPDSGSNGGLLDELASEDVQSHEEGRNESSEILRQEGARVRGYASRPDATGDVGGRSLGVREGGNVPASGEITVEEEAKHEIEVKDDLAVQEQPKGSNFVIPEKGLSLPSGEKARYKANINAIKTLRTIMAEGRLATPSEQEILSKYVGWGGIADAFDERKTDWAKEYKQLKGLLTEEEYKAARGSTLNAHYTEIGVIRGIYTGLEKIGFKGGRLLEPSAGIGHFVGAMPANLLPGVKSWTMVELDNITGNIAKYLYPNADVRIQGFETANIPDNYMDMAISNVPFGNYAIIDKTYPKEVTRAIHNYFFAKSLDKVRPGGLVVFITSRFTMDSQDASVRQYIMKRADLLGAIRLPDTAFKGNAGTEVVTDIIVLKKREVGTKYSGEAFENTGRYHQDMRIWEQTNEYYQNHPDMVLGTPTNKGSMYRSDSLTYTAKDTKVSLQKQIEKAFSKIKGKMDYPERPSTAQVREEIKKAEAKGKEGSIVKKDGKYFKIENGTLKAAEIAEKDAARMDAVIGIRDVGRKLLSAQNTGATESEIKEYRKELNKLYDEFVKKHGPLHKQSNARLIHNDSDYPFILALENYNKETKTAEKTAIFYRDTVSKKEIITHTDTIDDGLTVALNKTGEVDIKLISELTGNTEQQVRNYLLNSELVYLDRGGNMVTAENYLSGNVKAKLRDAEALAEIDPVYKRNVEALKKIIPADIAPEDISVRLGVTWVPDTIYSDFAAEMLGSSNKGYSKAAIVQYTSQLGQYNVTINQAWLKTRPESISTWGTPDKPFHKILEATLNNRNVTVWRKTSDGGRVIDKQATAAAQEKQEKILAEFQRWIWDNNTRKTELAKLYNDVFNNTVTPHYDGSKLTVDGANVLMPLRPHQKDAVQRIINSGGNTLLAHRVGAGKTYEMAAAAMKLRQLGVVKKPMFVVPKSLVGQWGKEFLEYFPIAKVLVAGENSFNPANRKQFINQIATGDYDAVILSYEQFKSVPMSAESQEAFYQQQIDELEEAIRLSAQKNGRRDPSIKQLEKSKKALEAKLRKKGDMKKDTDNTDFELLGVDSLFVDEAHNFKNLFYTTNMNNVSGLGNKNGTERAFDLYMKVRYLQKLNGGRGIVFATATPVMNSMSEMYIMQKYLQGDLLDARGLSSFDAWANQFGEVRTVLEMNPSGKGYRQKQSFSRFKNLAELQQMFRSFADVLIDIPGLKIPAMKTGKRIVVECEPSDFQMAYIDSLAERADAIKKGSVDPKEDNMLKITSEGRKLSYTQRMIDPSLPYEPGNKIEKCAANIYEEWENSKDIKGAQIVFCDLSTPKGGAVTEESSTEADLTTPDADDISIYDDLKNILVAQGIPAKEIAFIHDADNQDKRTKLFESVNEGNVRVLIGSTGKMGVGMNAQKRVVALHHLDAPWRPGDIEQREGRALRQGNMNDEVSVYVYVTKKTFDSRMWDNLQRKASFINQVMSGDLTARESEGDGDFALSAAEIKAISSGNPLIMEQFEVAADLARLESLERAHNKEVLDAKIRLQKAHSQLISDKETLKQLEKDLAVRKDTSGDKFTAVIGGNTFTERKAAGEAIIEQAKKHFKLNAETEELYKIGNFAGFDLYVNNKNEMILRGSAKYRNSINMQSAVGTTQSLEALPKRIDTRIENTKQRINENTLAIKKLEQIMSQPFDRADELATARRRNAEILAELNPSEDTAAGMEDDDTDERIIESSDDTIQNSRGTSPKSEPSEWTAELNKDSKVEAAMPLTDLIEKIQHDLGLNITFGHVRGKNVLGLFSRNNRGVRSRLENDLPTISHEIGHWYDNKYGFTSNDLPKGVAEELKEALGKGAENYPKRKHKSEGLAEFIRQYLQSRDTASVKYPETTKYVLGSMDAKSLAIFDQLADEINAVYALDSKTASSAIRSRDERIPDYRTPKEKIQDMGDDFYQAWVDSNHAIKRLDEATGGNAYIYATNAAYSDAVAARIITGDLTDPNGQFVATGLKTALQGINTRNKKEWRDFGEYLVVCHGPERLVNGKDVFSNPTKNTIKWMMQRQRELENEYPAFKEAQKRVVEFEKLFTQVWGVNTGLIAQELFDSWGELYENHVPLNRVIPIEKSGIAGVKKGFANQNNPFKRAKGSGLDIIHPVENIINNIVLLVNAGMRNNVMTKIADVADQYGADATFMERIPTPMVRKSFNMAGIKSELSDKMAKAAEEGTIAYDSLVGIDTVIDGINDVMYQYERGKARGDIITVMRYGNPEFWKVNDPKLLESITHLSPPKMYGLLEAYAKTTRFMTANITGNNPIWSIFSNAPRDLGTFFAYSKQKNPIKAIQAIVSTYINAFNKTYRDGKNVDPLYAEFLAMGGGHASAYSADADLAKKARKAFTSTRAQRVIETLNPINWVSFISDTIEMGPRFATYKLMRLAGLDPQTAFYEAMDVTVNFRKAGLQSRQVNKVVPFFNASVQGIDKFGRYFSAADINDAAEDRGKSTRAEVAGKRISAFIAASAILAAISYLINAYNDERKKDYQQLSNYTKNSYWCIPIGDGKYFCIPKPRELAVITSLFETSLERWEGGNEHAFDEFYQYTVDNFLPSVVSDLAQIPTNIAQDGVDEGLKESFAGAIGSMGMLGVGFYITANRDFLGKPIESTAMKDLEPRDRFNANTSKIAYWVGKAFNMSPVMIDYFGNQVLGYIWKVPRALFPVSEDSRDLTLGVKATYVKDNEYSTDLVNWLYDRAEKTDLVRNSDKWNMDKVIAAHNDSCMTKFYSRFNSLNKDNDTTTSKRVARQAVLDIINEYRKSVDSGYETEAQQKVYDVLQSSGDTVLLPSVMNTYVPYTEVIGGNEYDKKYYLSDAQYVEYQTLYNGYYWSLAESTLTDDMTDKAKKATLRQAKNVAKMKADEDMIKQLSILDTGETTKYSDYAAKYPGVPDNEIITFKVGLDMADDDDHLYQDEIIDILAIMASKNLTEDDARTLWHTKYKSDKNFPSYLFQ